MDIPEIIKKAELEADAAIQAIQNGATAEALGHLEEAVAQASTAFLMINNPIYLVCGVEALEERLLEATKKWKTACTRLGEAGAVTVTKGVARGKEAAAKAGFFVIVI